MMAEQTNKTTTDHDLIKKWAESRNGKPAVVTSGDEETNLLRINFPGYSEENLKEIDWDKWFDVFDDNNLALVYQEKTKDGEDSNFNKIVSRENA
ncbi:MAG: hypothetical protein WD317_09600 [Balneolaceae bacterium]